MILLNFSVFIPLMSLPIWLRKLKPHASSHELTTLTVEESVRVFCELFEFYQYFYKKCYVAKQDKKLTYNNRESSFSA